MEILVVVTDKPKMWNVHVIYIPTETHAYHKMEILTSTTENKYYNYQANPFAKC